MSTELDTLEAPLGATAERQAVIAAQGAAPDKDWVIVTRGIKREYDMGGEVVRALRGVDVAIQRNEYVAIMGPSGSGKSTLMNVIGCLDTPNAGEYWLNGLQVSKMSDDALARVRNKEIGFVFQTFNLLARATALHNVELPLVYAGVGAEERKRRAKEALERVQLGSRMDHRPNEPSGGQRQRRHRARAGEKPPSSSPTSPPVTSTPRPPRRSCGCSRACRAGSDGHHGHTRTRHCGACATRHRLPRRLAASDDRRSSFVEKLGITAPVL